MPNFKKHLTSFLLCLLTITPLVFLHQVTSTQGQLWDSQIGMNEIGSEYGGQDKESAPDLRIVVVEIINKSMIVLGIIFFALFLFSGFQWMTAGGNEDAVKKAKARMSNAAIGVIITLLSWSLTYFIMKRLVAIASGKNNYMNPY